MAFLLVGDDTGLVKRVRLRDNSIASKLGTQAAERSIHALDWSGAVSAESASADDAWESREKELVVGLRSGVVELWQSAAGGVVGRFDALSVPSSLRQAHSNPAPIDQSARAPKTLNAGSKLAGLAVLRSPASSEDRLLTCSSSGLLHLRPISSLRSKYEQRDESDDADAEPPTGAHAWLVGSDISTLRVDPVNQSRFVAGGKEHLLKLWDLASAAVVWKEKNVAHDELNLRQQVWHTAVQFMPGSDAELVSGTAWHQLRRYDTRAQKRALWSVELGDYAVTSLSVTPDGRGVVVGDAGGRLQQRDLRMAGRMMHVYHGIGGSVRAVECHPALPLVAACGLDRFARVYDTNTRKQVNKVYLKQKLNSLLWSSQTPASAAERDQVKREEDETEAGSGEEGDELWSELNARAARAVAAKGHVAGDGSGQYVKKRKEAAAADEESASKKTKVKLEPLDDDSAPASAASAPASAPAVPSTLASAASSSFKVKAKPSPFMKLAPAASSTTSAKQTSGGMQQIVFRQSVAFDDDDEEDEEGEDGEDEDEEMDEGAEDDDQMDEAAEEDDADESEEEPEPEPQPAPTPARATRATRRSVAPTVPSPAQATPARNTRSRTAAASKR